MPIFGAIMSISFFWRPVFCSFIGSGIRNFTKSFLIFFHPPIVFSTDLMNPQILRPFYQKSQIHVKVPLSQKIQIKPQQKQCFNSPMSSLKALVTKKKTTTIYIAWETEVRKPSTWPETGMNVSSWHSSQFWLVSLWSYFTYCNFIFYDFILNPCIYASKK